MGVRGASRGSQEPSAHPPSLAVLVKAPADNMVIRFPWPMSGSFVCEHSGAIHWLPSTFVGRCHTPSHEVVVLSL
jgi:hypothetical protein